MSSTQQKVTLSQVSHMNHVQQKQINLPTQVVTLQPEMTLEQIKEANKNHLPSAEHSHVQNSHVQISKTTNQLGSAIKNMLGKSGNQFILPSTLSSSSQEFVNDNHNTFIYSSSGSSPNFSRKCNEFQIFPKPHIEIIRLL